MIEKHIVLDDIDLLTFYGVNNIHLQMIKALYPKLRIVARGNVIHVMGDELEMSAFEENIDKLQQHCPAVDISDPSDHPVPCLMGQQSEKSVCFIHVASAILQSKLQITNIFRHFTCFFKMFSIRTIHAVFITLSFAADTFRRNPIRHCSFLLFYGHIH